MAPGSHQHQFPMPGAEAARLFHQYLTPFERDEVKQYDIVYYMNLTSNRKAQVLNGILPQQPSPQEQQEGGEM